ncbi:MAG TPA: DUF177 domain-containing protein [Bdellovibrionota bacterium]|jgi:uncharacterized protein|nr:DUF177 domain-containing protein [Bdellovibrionota bacterium]
MKIFLSEIKEIESDLQFDGDEEPWLRDTVLKLDERAGEDSPEVPSARRAPLKDRSVTAEFTVSQVDGVVVLNGSIDTEIQLLCSRCASPFQFQVNPRFTALYSQDPRMAGIPSLQDSDGRPRHVTRGKAHSQHTPEDRDLDITYLTEDFIDVGELVAEQLRLQLPFQPLCSEGCKGICANCGADLNRGRCACDRIIKESPFSQLGKIKIETHH